MKFILKMFFLWLLVYPFVVFSEPILNQLTTEEYYSDNCRTNWITYPCNKWTLQHVRELMYTAEVSKGTAQAYNFTIKRRNIDNIFFKNYKGVKMPIKEWLSTSDTDGFIVLKNGSIVSEIYKNNMNQTSKHNLFSVTKSFVGTIATYLIKKNMININDKIVKYIPDLSLSGFKNYTINDLLNMNNNINFKEDYDERKSDFYVYTCAITNSCKDTPHSNLRKYLKSIKIANEQHPNKFDYATPATDVLLWFNEIVSKKKFQELLSELIWSKIGAENDGYFIIDRAGVPYGGAGLNISLRDAAKFGQMMLQKGFFNHQQILPKEVVQEIQKGGDKEFFARNKEDAKFLPKGSYKNQWWMYGNDHNAYMAIGIFGQWIYIDPTSQVVAVKFSSLHEADTYENGVNAYRAMDAISRSL